MSTKTILVFDPCSDGHHAGYILNLLRHLDWTDSDYRLQMLVSEDFIDRHEDLIDFTRERLQGRVNWWTLSIKETNSILNASGSLARGKAEWSVLRKHSKTIPHDEVLHMYADYTVSPLAMHSKIRKPFTGILFRQNLHYPKMFGSNLESSGKMRTHVKGVLLKMALNHSQLKSLLCLDNYLPRFFSEEPNGHKLRPCPDPVYLPDSETLKTPESLKDRSGLTRHKLLLFGVISERKGFGHFLDEANKLSPEQLNLFSFYVVGPTMEETEGKRVQKALHELESKGAHVIREDRFVRDEEIQSYFHASDYIVTPYKAHIGMSAVIVRAAAAGKPVIASDFGLLGKLVNNHRLGMTFGEQPKQSVGDLLERVLSGNEIIFDHEEAKRFSSMNDARCFGEAVFGCFEERGRESIRLSVEANDLSDEGDAIVSKSA